MMQSLGARISRYPEVPSAFGDDRAIFYRLCLGCFVLPRHARCASVFYFIHHHSFPADQRDRRDICHYFGRH